MPQRILLIDNSFYAFPQEIIDENADDPELCARIEALKVGESTTMPGALGAQMPVDCLDADKM